MGRGKYGLLALLILSSLAHAADTSNVDSRTQLMVFLQAQGGHSQPGDSFELVVTVRNVGSHPAVGTAARLEGIPAGWKVSTGSPAVTPLGIAFGTIGAGGEATGRFHVVRDGQDSTVNAVAWASNAKQVSSELIPIPISALATVLLGAAIVGLYLKAG